MATKVYVHADIKEFFDEVVAALSEHLDMSAQMNFNNAYDEYEFDESRDDPYVDDEIVLISKDEIEVWLEHAYAALYINHQDLPEDVQEYFRNHSVAKFRKFVEKLTLEEFSGHYRGDSWEDSIYIDKKGEIHLVGPLSQNSYPGMVNDKENPWIAIYGFPNQQQYG
ncbi:MAG: hypothetical protein AAB875_06095, partial [Patescibacteria group bacterium]